MTKSFIKEQQELAKPYITGVDQRGRRWIENKDLDTLITQVITNTGEVLMEGVRELKQKDSHIGIGGLYTADMEMAHNAAIDQALQIIGEVFKSEE